MPSKRTRYGIVASRFNRELTERLAEGAIRALKTKKISPSKIDLVWVPGAFELASAALHLARSNRYRAIVAVGCIIEGETSHHRHLSGATLTGLITAGVVTGVPVTCGVITASSWKLASARAQKRGVNRGKDAALAAWELTQTLRRTPRGGR